MNGVEERAAPPREDSLFGRLAAEITGIQAELRTLDTGAWRLAPVRRARPVDRRVAVALAAGLLAGALIYLAGRLWGVVGEVLLVVVVAAPVCWRAGWWLGGRQ